VEHLFGAKQVLSMLVHLPVRMSHLSSVQALLSLQVIGVNLHPLSVQVSMVQGLLSLHLV
jgi:hypothetical protein